MTTLTALFDSRSDAETARQRLNSASIGVRNVDIHDQSSASTTTSGGYSTSQDRGFWAGLKDAFLPDEDRYTYEEGVRRGHTLLTAEVEDRDADEAIRILDTAECVDIEERSAQWRSSGWDAPTTGTTSTYATDTTRADLGTVGANNEERIPIVEEELRVGKREVNRGSVRVRSYAVETPVHEQVSLRDEHVSVERHAVNQPISAATADAFQDRTIEMTETSEEAVVAKEARVREELVVRKDVGEHVEDIEDTVRHTEVEVDGDRATELSGEGVNRR